GHVEISVADAQIVVVPGDPLSGVTLADEPSLRMNYEITVEAMKLMGSDFFCGLTFPVGPASCTLIAGGWGGALVGLSSIDGQDASENSTTQFRKFDVNHWYRFRVRVTPDRIQAWIDDEQLIDADIDEKEIGMRPGEI